MIYKWKGAISKEESYTILDFSIPGPIILGRALGGRWCLSRPGASHPVLYSQEVSALELLVVVGVSLEKVIEIARGMKDLDLKILTGTR